MTTFVALLICSAHGCQPTGSNSLLSAGLTFIAWESCAAHANVLLNQRNGTLGKLTLPSDGKYRIRGTNQWYECDWVKTTEIAR